MTEEPWYNPIVVFVSGMSVPLGSSERVRNEVQVPHLELVTFLDEFQNLVAQVTGGTAQGANGDWPEAYVSAMKTFLSGDGADYVSGLRDTAAQLADGAHEFAYQLDYTNLMIVLQVLAFLVEWAITLIMWEWNPIGAAIEQAILQQVFKVLFGNTLRRFLTHAAMTMVTNVALSSALDGLARWILALRGEHTSQGDQYRKSAALSGAVQGAFGAAVPLLTGPIKKLISKGFSPSATKSMQESIENALKHPSPSAPSTPARTVTEFADPSGSFGPGLAALTVPMRVGLLHDVVSKKAQNEFRDAVGDQFERAFGTRLGSDLAREMGSDWASAFLAHANGKDLSAALKSTLGPMEKLGTRYDPLRSALSDGVAEAMPSVWKEKPPHLLVDTAFSMGHQNLSEGVVNYIEQGEFTTSKETTFGALGGDVLGHAKHPVLAGVHGALKSALRHMDVKLPQLLVTGHVNTADADGFTAPPPAYTPYVTDSGTGLGDTNGGEFVPPPTYSAATGDSLTAPHLDAPSFDSPTLHAPPLDTPAPGLQSPGGTTPPTGTNTGSAGAAASASGSGTNAGTNTGSAGAAASASGSGTNAGAGAASPAGAPASGTPSAGGGAAPRPGVPQPSAGQAPPSAPTRINTTSAAGGGRSLLEAQADTERPAPGTSRPDDLSAQDATPPPRHLATESSGTEETPDHQEPAAPENRTDPGVRTRPEARASSRPHDDVGRTVHDTPAPTTAHRPSGLGPAGAAQTPRQDAAAAHETATHPEQPSRQADEQEPVRDGRHRADGPQPVQDGRRQSIPVPPGRSTDAPHPVTTSSATDTHAPSPADKGKGRATDPGLPDGRFGTPSEPGRVLSADEADAVLDRLREELDVDTYRHVVARASAITGSVIDMPLRLDGGLSDTSPAAYSVLTDVAVILAHHLDDPETGLHLAGEHARSVRDEWNLPRAPARGLGGAPDRTGPPHGGDRPRRVPEPMPLSPEPPTLGEQSEPSQPSHLSPPSPPSPAAELLSSQVDLGTTERGRVVGELVERLNNGELSAARMLVKRAADRVREEQSPESRDNAIALHAEMTRQLVNFSTLLEESGADLPSFVEVPKEINLIWLGRPMSVEAVRHVLAWAETAKKSGWTVNLWSDTTTSDLTGKPVSTWNASHKRAIQAVGVHIREATELLPSAKPAGLFSFRARPAELDPRMAKLRDIYFKARTRPAALPMASDVLRYAILKTRGGAYLDVDIAPGRVSLDTPPTRVGSTDVPFLAPIIRDQNQLVLSRVEIAAEQGRRPEDVTLGEVVRHRLGNAEYGNNLIVVPPKSAFMDAVVDAISDSVRELDVADLEGNGAFMTGPSVLARALSNHIESFGLGRTTLLEEAALLDPREMYRWEGVDWITDESDNTDYEHTLLGASGPGGRPTAPQPIATVGTLAHTQAADTPDDGQSGTRPLDKGKGREMPSRPPVPHDPARLLTPEQGEQAHTRLRAELSEDAYGRLVTRASGIVGSVMHMPPRVGGGLAATDPAAHSVLTDVMDILAHHDDPTTTASDAARAHALAARDRLGLPPAPAKGLAGSTTTEQGTDEAAPSPAADAAAGPSRRPDDPVPEHVLWRRLFDTSEDTRQPLADISAARGTEPPESEVTLRRAVHDELVRLPGLTVVVGEAANFGHQAAATMMLQSLTELGYTGPVRIIAPDSVRQRLDLLLSPSMRERVEWETDEFDNAATYAPGHRPDRGHLVFVAANDALVDDSGLASDFLDFSGAERAVVLKPYAWGEGHRLLYARNADGTASVTDLQQENGISRSALYHYEVPRPTGAALDDLITAQAPSTAHATHLLQMVRAVSGGALELMPAYGLHNLHTSERASVLPALAEGIHAAGLPTPAVILALGNATVAHAPEHRADWLRHHTLDSPGLSRALTDAGPGDVIVVTAGSLPQELFRQVYQLGSLPAVVEGANTTNALQLQGRPYFSVRADHTPYDPLAGTPQDEAAVSALHGVTGALVQETQWGREQRQTAAFDRWEESATAISTLKALQPADHPVLTVDEADRFRTVIAASSLGPTGAEPSSDTALFVAGDPVETAARLLGTDHPDWATLKEFLTPSDPGDYRRAMRLEGRSVTLTPAQRDTLLAVMQHHHDTYLDRLREETADFSVAPEAEHIATIARAITHAADPDTTLGAYFHRLHQQAHHPDNDQVLQALAHVLATPTTHHTASTRTELDDGTDDSSHDNAGTGTGTGTGTDVGDTDGSPRPVPHPTGPSVGTPHHATVAQDTHSEHDTDADADPDADTDVDTGTDTGTDTGPEADWGNVGSLFDDDTPPTPLVDEEARPSISDSVFSALVAPLEHLDGQTEFTSAASAVDKGKGRAPVREGDTGDARDEGAVTDAGAAITEARLDLARAESRLNRTQARYREGVGTSSDDDTRLVLAHDDHVRAGHALSEAEAHWFEVTQGEPLPEVRPYEGTGLGGGMPLRRSTQSVADRDRVVRPASQHATQPSSGQHQGGVVRPSVPAESPRDFAAQWHAQYGGLSKRHKFVTLHDSLGDWLQGTRPLSEVLEDINTFLESPSTRTASSSSNNVKRLRDKLLEAAGGPPPQGHARQQPYANHGRNTSVGRLDVGHDLERTDTRGTHRSDVSAAGSVGRGRSATREFFGRIGDAFRRSVSRGGGQREQLVHPDGTLHPRYTGHQQPWTGPAPQPQRPPSATGHHAPWTGPPPQRPPSASGRYVPARHRSPSSSRPDTAHGHGHRRSSSQVGIGSLVDSFRAMGVGPVRHDGPQVSAPPHLHRSGTLYTQPVGSHAVQQPTWAHAAPPAPPRFVHRAMAPHLDTYLSMPPERARRWREAPRYGNHPTGREGSVTLEFLSGLEEGTQEHHRLVVNAIGQGSVTQRSGPLSQEQQTYLQGLHPALSSFFSYQAGHSDRFSDTAANRNPHVVRYTVGNSGFTMHADPGNAFARHAGITYASALRKVLGKFDVPELDLHVSRYNDTHFVIQPDLTVEEHKIHTTGVQSIVHDGRVAAFLAPSSIVILAKNGVSEDALIHEIGHALHRIRNPALYEEVGNANWIDQRTQRFAADATSSAAKPGYAGESPLEFVAEVFLRLVKGQSVHPTMMAMYEAFGGAMPDR
ncbi:glycosyltransferase [Streptomyces sp. NPDC003247]|uniref:glycosyltransferase n=1 Tax=Streptomyces sp. NPDC003247 TaxID=3364677 RepID=UPI0036966065